MIYWNYYTMYNDSNVHSQLNETICFKCMLDYEFLQCAWIKLQHCYRVHSDRKGNKVNDRDLETGTESERDSERERERETSHERGT